MIRRLRSVRRSWSACCRDRRYPDRREDRAGQQAVGDEVRSLVSYESDLEDFTLKLGLTHGDLVLNGTRE